MSSDTRTKPKDVEAKLTSFVTELEYDDIPDEGIRTAERCYLDTLGVALAGSVEPPGRIAANTAATAGNEENEATIIGSKSKASATDAAFVNGTASHALDFDDVTRGTTGHPSAPLIPASLAIGELVNASGRDLLTAYIAGFEAANFIGSVIYPGHYQEGWHSTGTYGPFSAAAASASLLGLDTDETRTTLNIAASSPAGVQRNFGSMTKPMHAGQAARAGVTAALLASDGFTADGCAISAENGFFDLYQGPTGIDLDGAYPLGEQFAICTEGVQVKKFPCCYRTHPAVASGAELSERYDIEPRSIETVTVVGSEKGPQILQHEDPQTGFEGKFSMHYTVACGIALNRVGLEAFDDENVDNPDVQYVRERVNYESDPDIPYMDYETQITIEMKDGSVCDIVHDDPPGRNDPLSDNELGEKFMMCAKRALKEDAARDARDRIGQLRRLSHREIGQVLNVLSK